MLFKYFKHFNKRVTKQLLPSSKEVMFLLVWFFLSLPLWHISFCMLLSVLTSSKYFSISITKCFCAVFNLRVNNKWMQSCDFSIFMLITMYCRATLWSFRKMIFFNLHFYSMYVYVWLLITRYLFPCDYWIFIFITVYSFVWLDNIWIYISETINLHFYNNVFISVTM